MSAEDLALRQAHPLYGAFCDEDDDEAEEE